VIDYRTELEGIEAAQLEGFFDGWPAAPTSEALLDILRASAFAALACDGDQVVGFVNALSDGALAVYIPLLEVRASYRSRGIGSELVGRVLSRFSDAYMVDAVCDPDVAPFYERLGMARLAGMAHRNREAPILRSSR
jgi:GNAT superfamily N-acetyltransferase